VTTSTRERALAALFAIVDAEPWFRTRERNSVFALDHVEHADSPAVVMVDGGDAVVPQSHAALTTDITVYFWLAVRPTTAGSLVGKINEARHRLLTKLAGWAEVEPALLDNTAVALRYISMTDPDVDDDGAPYVTAAIEMRLQIEEREFSPLSF
jgi:hypothetical protein